MGRKIAAVIFIATILQLARMAFAQEAERRETHQEAERRETHQEAERRETRLDWARCPLFDASGRRLSGSTCTVHVHGIRVEVRVERGRFLLVQAYGPGEPTGPAREGEESREEGRE